MQAARVPFRPDAPDASPRAGEPGRDFAFTGADFARIRALIHRRAGISLSDHKRDMAYSRLARRLRAARAHVELFRTKPPAAPQPARPRIELFGGRGASAGASGTAGAARTGSASGGSPYAGTGSPYAGSPFAGAAHPATPSKKQEA
ncbi:hypothetical protein [Burkholderia multivorans]|uniref:hypothetical protein n=1 Tax=Burkholderia multivorans TaxID=87883 RepID=UPI003F57987F